MQDIGHLILPALRGIQALFSLVTLALSATIIHWYDTHITPDNTPKSFLFLVFSGVFTILFVVPYVVFAPKHFPELVNAYASLVLEAITLIFWFAGFVAGSVYLGQIDRCRGAICTNAKASVVFAALLWYYSSDHSSLSTNHWAGSFSASPSISQSSTASSTPHLTRAPVRHD